MAVVTTPAPIPLQGITALNTPYPEPKFIKTERAYLANYYVIKVVDSNNVESWHYYPVKISKEQKGNFYKFEVTPPFLKEGFVCLNKTFIHVPLNDLIRGNINVTRAESNTSTTQTTTSTTKRSKSKSSTDKPSSGDISGDEERKNIDLAFDDQIKALLYSENVEEGGFWELSDNS